MEKVEFSTGRERDFFSFIAKLDDKEKIALISHNDLDGIVCAKVSNEVLNAKILKFINYEEINDSLVNELKANKIKKVVFTDLSITNKEILKKIESFANILIIDHHLVIENLNSNKTVSLNAQGYCAAYLCYYLFFKVQDVSKFDWLVTCACLSDWCYKKNENWLKEVYEHYKAKFNSGSEKIKSGKFWDMQLILSLALIYFNTDVSKVYGLIGDKIEDLKNLTKYSAEVFNEVKLSVKKFEKEKQKVKRGYFWEIHSRFQIKEIVINILSTRDLGITFIISEKRGNFYKFSMRRQDGKVNVAELAKELVSGLENGSAGGHFKAAGGYVLLKDAAKLREKLKEI